MCRVLIFKRIFLLLVLVFFLVPKITKSNDVVINSDVSISAQVSSIGTGGSNGSGSLNLPTIVNFSGIAYPLSRVYLLRDGNMTSVTIADQNANFSFSLNGLSTNIYFFSIYGEDFKGRKSSLFSFPIYVVKGTTVNISNILLSPTVDINKKIVKKGENLVIFGQSVPNKEITISVLSDKEYVFNVFSNFLGTYFYNLDTSILAIGQNQAKSRFSFDAKSSLYSFPTAFFVTESDNKKDDLFICSLIRGDLNCDKHVNLIDFSILAYWYKKNNPPSRVDLNGDKKITLIDFSIMVFNWTG